MHLLTFTTTPAAAVCLRLTSCCGAAIAAGVVAGIALMVFIRISRRRNHPGFMMPATASAKTNHLNR